MPCQNCKIVFSNPLCTKDVVFNDFGRDQRPHVTHRGADRLSWAGVHFSQKWVNGN